MSGALTLSDGGRAGSLVVAPQTFGEVVQFAEMMSKCSFVPKHLRNRPADCMAVCLQALRWEMDPFSVAQKTYFVSEGSAPGYEAQLISAVVHSRAPLDGRLSVEWAGEGAGLSCTVTGKFRGDPVPKAKTCKIASITTKNSPLWKSDPEQQLAYYTVRAWARLYCPDIIMGVHTKDELSESFVGPENAKDVTPPPASRLDALEATITGSAAPSPRAAEESAGGVSPPASPAAPTDEFGLPPLDDQALAPGLYTPDGEMIPRSRTALEDWRRAWADELADKPDAAAAWLDKFLPACIAAYADKPEAQDWIRRTAAELRGQ